MTDKQVPAVNQEEAPDENLVEQAYNELTEIATRRVSQTMFEVGEYLIKTFYDDNIEYAQSKTPTKEKSLNQLFSKFRKDPDAYSKSWFYNSIQLYADQKYFDSVGFDKYNELGVTHKIYLTHLHDIEAKKELIEEAVDKKYTVAKLKERIAEKQGKVTIPLNRLPESDKLRKWSLEHLQKVRAKGDKDIKKLNNRLKAYREKRSALDEIIKEKEQNEK